MGQSLSGVEIFKAGTWNGDKFTVDDIDAIVDAFGKTGYEVPIKLGHSDDVGGMAWGWVKALRRIGETLIADFIDLPDQLYQAIKDRRFNHISSEIFFNVKRGAETFRRALKAVAILGAETPAVAGLKPLREVLMQDQHEGVRFYNTKENPDMSDPKDKATIEELNGKVTKLTADLGEATKKLEAALADKTGDEAKQQVKKLQSDIAALTKSLGDLAEAQRQATVAGKIKGLRVPAFAPFIAAMYDLTTSAPKMLKFTAAGEKEAKDTDATAVVDGLVEAINKSTERFFKAISGGADLSEFENEPAGDIEDAGKKVDALTQAYMKDKGVKDYSEARRAVLSDPANADLKAAYAAVA